MHERENKNNINSIISSVASAQVTALVSCHMLLHGYYVVKRGCHVVVMWLPCGCHVIAM